MSDRPAEGTGAPDAGRRRFGRAGLAAPAVLGSLASPPVLGAAPYFCTISGKISGNVSAPRDTTPSCLLGRSPGYWKNKAWTSTPFTKGTTSGGGTVFNGTQGLANAFKLFKGEVYDSRQGFPLGATAATMLQVLNSPGGLNDSSLKALGRATVASLLNAYAFAGSYPLAAADVVRLFNGVYAFSGQKVEALPGSGVYWTDNDVKDYFELLYQDSP